MSMEISNTWLLQMLMCKLQQSHLQSLFIFTIYSSPFCAVCQRNCSHQVPPQIFKQAHLQTSASAWVTRHSDSCHEATAVLSLLCAERFSWKTSLHLAYGFLSPIGFAATINIFFVGTVLARWWAVAGCCSLVCHMAFRPTFCFLSPNNRIFSSCAVRFTAIK